MPYHITQRGVDRRETFSTDTDRFTYLKLLRYNLADAEVRLLAWCLMTNHVHLIAVPKREDSLAVLLRRVQGRYAQYYNACYDRTGHLWQNRYYACALGGTHLRRALIYAESNPVRAGLVARPEQYRWSSAAAHISGKDTAGLLDMNWWRDERMPGEWAEILLAGEPEHAEELRRCTYAGRPFGEENFVAQMSERFGRYWQPGRPKKSPAAEKPGPYQADLFL